MIIKNQTSQTVGCTVTADTADTPRYFSINRDDALTVAGRLLYSTPGSSVGPYMDLELAHADVAFLKYSLGVACHIGTEQVSPVPVYSILIDDDPTSKDVS